MNCLLYLLGLTRIAVGVGMAVLRFEPLLWFCW